MFEMIVLCGVPGSGKSTLAKIRYPTYRRINLDTLKTRRREHMAILDAIKNSENVIIDNTNATRKTRKNYIDLAKIHKVSIKAVFLDCPLDLALKRNLGRTGEEKVPDHVIRRYHRNLEVPKDEEGFQVVEIVEQVTLQITLDPMASTITYGG